MPLFSPVFFFAGFFGGGGHPYAAGFRTYDTSYEEVVSDLVRMLPPMLAETETQRD